MAQAKRSSDSASPDWSLLFPPTGCDFWADCLTCPLPQCRLEQQGFLQRREGDYVAIMQQEEGAENLTVVSERTVFRRAARVNAGIVPFSPEERQAWQEFLRKRPAAQGGPTGS